MDKRLLACFMLLFITLVRSEAVSPQIVGQPDVLCHMESCCQCLTCQWTVGTILGVPTNMCCAKGEVIQNSLGICCTVDDTHDCV